MMNKIDLRVVFVSIHIAILSLVFMPKYSATLKVFSWYSERNTLVSIQSLIPKVFCQVFLVGIQLLILLLVFTG